MPGLSHALVPAQESKRWSFGRLLLLPVIQKGLFLGPKKSRKIRHANTGLPSKHTSNPHLGFATASLESGSANIDDSPLQECRDSPQNCKSERHKPLLKHL